MGRKDNPQACDMMGSKPGVAMRRENKRHCHWKDEMVRRPKGTSQMRPRDGSWMIYQKKVGRSTQKAASHWALTPILE